MYGVYGPLEGELIFGPTPTAADAHAYIAEASVCVDTTNWVVLPIDIPE